jgi:hypothetical protein
MKKTSENGTLPTALVGMICLAGLCSAAERTEEPAPSSASWEAYKVIVERNMFSRQRGAAEQRQRDEAQQVVTVPDPESYYRLRGIAQENGTFIAFIEDTRSSETLKVRQGETVARGSIESLDLDSITFRLDDRTIPVTIGQDLLGGQGAVTMSELMEWTPAPSTSTDSQEAAPATPSGDEAEILRQLMERRRRELEQ